MVSSRDRERGFGTEGSCEPYMPILYLIGGGLLLLAIGFLLGRSGRKTVAGAVPAEEIERLRREVRDLSQQLKETRDDLARKRELATKLPSLVRRLSEQLPPSAIPAIGVRFLKDFFRSRRVGFFAPVGDGTTFTLVEGAGFPGEWKGSVRIPSGQGMLGMALKKNTVICREEYAKSRGTQEIGSTPLEQLLGIADYIAPVPAASGTLGMIVIEGCPADMRDERVYASMLADLLGSSMDRARTLHSVELDAASDPLTGLSNRRHFAEWFEAEIRQAKNYHQPLSLVLFDIDHFKKVNDTYGHIAGDQVLKTLAETIRGTTRSSNLVARFGGEEFAVVMVSSAREQAVLYAESLRKSIEALEIRIPGQADPLRVTLSGGIASYPADADTTVDLIRAADHALYDAKREGRNRICVARRLGLDGRPI